MSSNAAPLGRHSQQLYHGHRASSCCCQLQGMDLDSDMPALKQAYLLPCKCPATSRVHVIKHMQHWDVTFNRPSSLPPHHLIEVQAVLIIQSGATVTSASSLGFQYQCLTHHGLTKHRLCCLCSVAQYDCTGSECAPIVPPTCADMLTDRLLACLKTAKCSNLGAFELR
jgi:hypothetical protein